MKKLKYWTTGLALLATSAGSGQETRQAALNHVPPAAALSELAWLAGEWLGHGITGPARETYSTPMGGAIAGHFAQARGDGILFYEFITITQRGRTLVYALKHFNADLTGWEERDEVNIFPLIAREGDTWFFDGLTIRRTGPDTMVGAVLAQASDGRRQEFVFRYRRVD